MMEKKSIEQILYEDLEKRESMNPDYYREAKKYSIHKARKLGLCDEKIKKLYGTS